MSLHEKKMFKNIWEYCGFRLKLYMPEIPEEVRRQDCQQLSGHEREIDELEGKNQFEVVISFL